MSNLERKGDLGLELGETTLKVYYAMLKERREMSLREVQRKAHLSSPSLALYHLNKLKDLELVFMHPAGGYEVARSVKVGVLRFFIGRGKMVVPRYAFYLFFFLTELVAYQLFFGFGLNPSDTLLLVTLLAGCIFTLIETVMMWRVEPIGFR